MKMATPVIGRFEEPAKDDNPGDAKENARRRALKFKKSSLPWATCSLGHRKLLSNFCRRCQAPDGFVLGSDGSCEANLGRGVLMVAFMRFIVHRVVRPGLGCLSQGPQNGIKCYLECPLREAGVVLEMGGLACLSLANSRAGRPLKGL